MDNLNPSEQDNLFVITFSYYYTLLKLQRFPPEIKFDKFAFFFNYGNHLMEFCLRINLPDHIKLVVLQLLS